MEHPLLKNKRQDEGPATAVKSLGHRDEEAGKMVRKWKEKNGKQVESVGKKHRLNCRALKTFEKVCGDW